MHLFASTDGKELLEKKKDQLAGMKAVAAAPKKKRTT